MVKSAERVIQILDFIKDSKEGITHKDFISGLGIPKSSMSALLSTLTASEYLSYDTMSKRYRLGPRILTLAGRYLAGLDIIRVAEPIIRQIVASLDESAELVARRGQDAQIIFTVDCSRPLLGVTDLGTRSPLHVSAAGKAILACLPDEEINEYFSTADMTPITEKTNTDPNITRQELIAIRSGSIAYCREELFLGISAMAMPIFDMYGRVAGSIVVPVPTIRFDKKKEKELERVLRDASTILSKQLGYSKIPN